MAPPSSGRGGGGAAVAPQADYSAAATGAGDDPVSGSSGDLSRPPPQRHYLAASSNHDYALCKLRDSELQYQELNRRREELESLQSLGRLETGPPPRRPRCPSLLSGPDCQEAAESLRAALSAGAELTAPTAPDLIRCLRLGSVAHLVQAALELGKHYGDCARPQDALAVFAGGLRVAQAHSGQPAAMRLLCADLHAAAAAIHLCFYEEGDTEHAQKARGSLIAACQLLVDHIRSLQGLGRRREQGPHAARVLELLDQLALIPQHDAPGEAYTLSPTKELVLRQVAERVLGARVTPVNRVPSVRPPTGSQRRARTVSLALAGCFWGGIGISPDEAERQNYQLHPAAVTPASAPPPHTGFGMSSLGGSEMRDTARPRPLMHFAPAPPAARRAETHSAPAPRQHQATQPGPPRRGSDTAAVAAAAGQGSDAPGGSSTFGGEESTADISPGCASTASLPRIGGSPWATAAPSGAGCARSGSGRSGAAPPSTSWRCGSGRPPPVPEPERRSLVLLTMAAGIAPQRPPLGSV